MKLQDILCRIGLHKWILYIEYFIEIVSICEWCKERETYKEGKWTKV